MTQVDPRRRHLSHWAAANAWKLSGLTAVVTLLGVFAAVSLSLLLRPTRSYFFPLLSDVDKHQPEGAILRAALIIAAALFFATTSASLLQCHSLRLFAPELHEASPRRTQVDETIPKRRRVGTVRILIMLPIILMIAFIILQYWGVAEVSVGRRALLRTAYYFLCLIWIVAMAFLVWYFLKLQHMPDRVSDDADEVEDTSFGRRMRIWGAWAIMLLRPVCLTGQVVCVIKIGGLWVALDNFSISNIRLVKIALLAALAFAEYTAAFFFAFFMTILAVDMRRKYGPQDVLLYA